MEFRTMKKTEKQILIFGGTTEGRMAAERLLAEGVLCTVCVATEYGSEVMEPHPLLTVHVGRMNRAEMVDMMGGEVYACVIDATHPHAQKVTEEIRVACRKTRMPYLRVERDLYNNDFCKNSSSGKSASGDLPTVLYAENAGQAASFLARTQGRILVTTGSRELGKIVQIIGDPSRISARVLPSPESLEACTRAGLKGDQIIAMQGPFDRQMNISTILHTRASWLLTKDSGRVGGYQEKLEAAQQCRIGTVVIRPAASDLSMPLEQVLETALGYAGMGKDGKSRDSDGMTWNADKDDVREGRQNLWLVGVGPGSHEARTEEAQLVLAQAEVIFGAESVLDVLNKDRMLKERVMEPVFVPIYDSARILQYLQDHPDICRAAVAYSGDSGFYSGASSMLSLLRTKQKFPTGVLEHLSVRIICGTSSVSWFAARAGIPWQNWKILSSHGRTCNIVGQVRSHPECFLLLSGAKDLRRTGRLLADARTEGVLGELRLIYGYELSRPAEEIRSCTPEKLCGFDENRLKEGLYVLYIEHKDAKKTPVLPGMADSCFLRGKAPMTSAEIRALSLCKLGLTGQAVVWDIGAGTGSVSVEAARTCPEGTVWSVEYKKDALELLYKNRAGFCLSNMEIIEGRAPEILKELPAPTHVFIGGSGGEIGAVIEQALAKNPRARFVADCITAETLMALQEAIKRLPVCNVQAVQVSVQRMEELGRYHYLKAQNPVFIISFSGK
ncbi:MAG: precorrin-6A reductase [Sarcina sp.]|nr:precorrin-6A reductase [Sarcina sp.]